MDFNKKANRELFNRNFWFKTAGIIFIIVIVFLAVADVKIYPKKRDLTAQINAYKKQIEDIKKSSQTLQDEIANANNTDYLEKLGYEQFGQARPGETEYIFVEPQNGAEVILNNNSENFWNRILNWIKRTF